MEVVWTGIGVIIAGIIFIIGGVLFRLGYWRTGYWLIPFSYYRTTIYGSIPLGCFMILLGAGFVFFLDKPIFNTGWVIVLRVLLAVFFFLYLFMWLFEPRFAKPDWINWLEDNHYEIIQELRYEVLRTGVRNCSTFD